MSYQEDFKKVRKVTVWSFWRVLALVVLVLVVIGVISFGFTMVSRPAQVIEQVTRPEKIISNYEWFREAYNDTKALDEQIVSVQTTISEYVGSLSEDRGNWSGANNNELSRLQSVTLGLRNQRSTVVAEYNARSMMITRSLFKGSGVPAELKIVDDRTIAVWE